MLDEFGGVDVRDEDRRPERLINPFHEISGHLGGGPDDHAIGLHEVRHGAALPEEFGVRDDVELGLFIVAADRFGDFFPGFDRHGRFIDDHPVLPRLEHVGDFAGYPFDMGEVHAAVGLRRRRDGDEKTTLRVIQPIFDGIW